MPRYCREIPQNRFWATARQDVTPKLFEAVLVHKVRGQAKKDVFFFGGRCVFSLDRPFNG